MNTVLITGREKQKQERNRRKEELMSVLSAGVPIRFTEVRNIIGSTAIIKELVEDGSIERLPFNLYTLPTYDNSWQALSALSYTTPNAVVCMTTAAAYHQLTTANPPEVHFAIPRDQSISKNQDISLKGYRWTEKSLTIGVEPFPVGNTTILMTNQARTVVDLLRSLNKTAEVEMAMEALSSFKGKPSDIIKIAKQLGCDTAIRPYTQAVQGFGRKL